MIRYRGDMAQAHTQSPRDRLVQRLLKSGTERFGNGDFEGALDRFDQARAIFGSREWSDRGYLTVQLNRAAVLHRLERENESLDIYLRALPVLDAPGTSAQFAKACVDCAAVLRSVGRAGLALNHLDRAWTILKDLDTSAPVNAERVAAFHRNCANCLATLQDWCGAARHLDDEKRVLATHARLSPTFRRGLVENRVTRARVAHLNGSPLLALEIIREVSDQQHGCTGFDPHTRAILAAHLAIIKGAASASLQRVEQALSSFEEARLELRDLPPSHLHIAEAVEEARFLRSLTELESLEDARQARLREAQSLIVPAALQVARERFQFPGRQDREAWMDGVAEEAVTLALDVARLRRDGSLVSELVATWRMAGVVAELADRTQRNSAERRMEGPLLKMPHGDRVVGAPRAGRRPTSTTARYL